MASQTLIDALQNSALFDHECLYFKVIETHISWVILTGQFAYKIKKPLDLGFIDYSTLAKRLHFCQEELRLNSLLAPETYLDVVAIGGTEENPQINDPRNPIEYAVRMNEFSQSMMFDQLLSEKTLSPEQVKDAARALADFHHKTNHCPPELEFGHSTQIYEPVKQNFDQIKDFLTEERHLQQLHHLETWSHQEHDRLSATMEIRKQQGFVKECHGDAHLGNIALVEEKPVYFDCIEFNDSLRWTDTMADLGFLVMDLEYQQQPEFAALAADSYMQKTGDYAGLAMLNYYKVYRAIVRGKVNLFQWSQAKDDEKPALWDTALRCFSLAEAYTQPPQPVMLITQGVTCSGKSTMARQLVKSVLCIHLSSDRERKRMAGLNATAKTFSSVNKNLYSHEMHQQTYQKLADLTSIIIQAGYSVVIDASFIKQQYRQYFIDLAAKLQVPFFIIQTQVEENTLRTWLSDRMKNEHETSEAYQEVLTMQLADQEALTTVEKSFLLQFERETLADIAHITKKTREKLIA